LSNPFYVGVVTYKGKEYPGAHESIIERDVWDRCQEIRARRKRQGGGSVPGRRAAGLLSEIVYCGECGDIMHWLESGNREHRHRYYYCRRRRKVGRDACTTTMERADTVNEQVLDVLRRMSIPPRLQAGVLEGARKRLAMPTSEPKTDRAKVEEQLRRLRIAYRSGDPDLTDEIYTREVARLQALLADTPRRPTALLDLQRATTFLGDLPLLLEAASDAQRRALVQTVLKTVWVAHGEIIAIQPALLFEVLADVTMVTLTGLEPVTSSSGGWRSIQLSYRAALTRRF
jgi:site-specific DNA recombinase